MTPTYSFTYFNKIHIQSFILCSILMLVMLVIPKTKLFKKNFNLNDYMTFLGFLCLLIKLF